MKYYAKTFVEAIAIAVMVTSSVFLLDYIVTNLQDMTYEYRR